MARRACPSTVLNLRSITRSDISVSRSVSLRRGDIRHSSSEGFQSTTVIGSFAGSFAVGVDDRETEPGSEPSENNTPFAGRFFFGARIEPSATGGGISSRRHGNRMGSAPASESAARLRQTRSLSGVTISMTPRDGLNEQLTSGFRLPMSSSLLRHFSTLSWSSSSRLAEFVEFSGSIRSNRSWGCLARRFVQLTKYGYLNCWVFRRISQ